MTRTLSGWSCGNLVDDASLLTSELVTNAVLHARTPVELTVCRTGGGVRVEVADADPRPLDQALRRRRRLDAIGGRGLAIVGSLARHWGVTPAGSGKSVWFEVGTGFGRDGAWVRPRTGAGPAPLDEEEDEHGQPHGRSQGSRQGSSR